MGAFYDDWGHPVFPNRAARRAGERAENRAPRRAARPQPLTRNAQPLAIFAKSIAARELATFVESLLVESAREEKRDLASQESNKSDFRADLDCPPPDPIPAADPGVNLTPRVVPSPRA